MAYSIYTYPGAYPGCGTFNVYAGTSPKHAQTVLEQIDLEMKKLLDGGIEEKEFLMVKAQLRGSYMLGLESASGRMQSIGRGELLLNHPPLPEETIAKIEAVCQEDVMRVAREILSTDPCAALVGKQAEKYLKYVK